MKSVRKFRINTALRSLTEPVVAADSDKGTWLHGMADARFFLPDTLKPSSISVACKPATVTTVSRVNAVRYGIR